MIMDRSRSQQEETRGNSCLEFSKDDIMYSVCLQAVQFLYIQKEARRGELNLPAGAGHKLAQQLQLG